jgi:hypothetical protein
LEEQRFVKGRDIIIFEHLPDPKQILLGTLYALLPGLW